MKKNLKQIIASCLAGVLTVATICQAVPNVANAATESTESYKLFVAFGGDAEAENDWGLSYAGGEVTGDITPTDGEISVGQTVTVGLEFANPVVNAWYFAPTMVAENVVDADFDVKVLVDGEEVACDLSAGDNWWYEETGDYDETQAVRIAGGYNEWATQYVSEPSGFTKLEFEITANSIQIGDGTEVAGEESDETYDMYLAFGGDAAEENDWAYSYDGSADVEGITATNAQIKVGETASVKLEFANPVVNTWYFAPFIVAENVVDADFDVKVLIDGEEVTVNKDAGANWWYEATGNFSDTEAVRIYGGYNEWGDQYVDEPSGFTTLEVQVTANSIKVGVPEEVTSAAGDVDLDGTYHAYIGFQTPKYSFRNAWSDETYGNGKDEFSQVTGWDADGNEIVVPGTFTDAEIAGNGTYTVSVSGLEFPDGEFDEQEYMNLIFLSTDIPNTGAITISDMTLNVDGSDVSGVNPLLNPDSVDYIDMQLQSTYNDDIASIGYYATPMSEMSITFTVSGFNYDNEGTVAASDDTEAAEVPTAKATGVPVLPFVIVLVVAVCVVAGVVVYRKKKAN